MGLSSKKTKTTPIVTEPMKTNLFGPSGYASKVTDFLATDPSQYVAPVSALQSQAFSAAQNLGGWKPYAQQASSLANDFASRPAPRVSATGYNAPQFGTLPSAVAARLGAAPTFEAVQLGGPALGQPVTLGPVSNAQAFATDFHSLLDDGGIQKYMDPGLQSYVNSTLADYDENAGRQRAAVQAQAAGNGAFGGSRYGLQLGQFDADTARGRASTEGELRRSAFEQGANLALADAARRSQIEMQNNQLRTTVSGQNAQAENERTITQGQFDLNRFLADQQARNQFGLAQGNLEQDARSANMGMLGQYGLQQAQLEQQAKLADADNRMRAALAQLGIDSDAARFGAEAQNSASVTNAQLQEQYYQRALQAAGLLGGLSTAYGANDRADLGLTSDLGGIQRGIESEYLNAYPTQLQIAGNLYHAIPPEAYIGTKSKTSGGVLGQVLGTAAQAAASYFSDRRLKADVKQIGWHGPLGLYRYRLLGDAKERVGVMADEVAVHAPFALGPVIGGYATVDYAKLGLAQLMEM